MILGLYIILAGLIILNLILKKSIINKPSALLSVFLFFICYLTIYAFLFSDLDAVSSMSKALFVGIITMTTYLTGNIFAVTSELQLWRFVRGVFIGILFGLIFLVFEFLFDALLTRAVIKAISYPINSAAFTVLNGTVTNLSKDYFNNQICALNIVFWPTFLLATLRPGGKGAQYSYCRAHYPDTTCDIAVI